MLMRTNSESSSDQCSSKQSLKAFVKPLDDYTPKDAVQVVNRHESETQRPQFMNSDTNLEHIVVNSSPKGGYVLAVAEPDSAAKSGMQLSQAGSTILGNSFSRQMIDISSPVDFASSPKRQHTLQKLSKQQDVINCFCDDYIPIKGKQGGDGLTVGRIISP